MDRRQFVRLTVGGGLGLLAAKLGLSAQETRAGGPGKSCVLLWLAGGPSQVDTFDLKPGLTPFKEIETAAPEIRISEGFPRLAKQMKRVSLVRTLHSNDPNHATATYLLHTGYRKAADLQHPHLGSVICQELGERGDLPGTIVVGGDPQCGAGYLPGDKGPVIFDRLETPAEDVKPAFSKERLEKRWRMLAALDRTFGEARDERLVDERRRSYERAYRVLSSDKVKAFDLSREEPGRYGSSPFGRACQLSRRLVEAGVRFVEVSMGDWDSHADNEAAHRPLMETLDTGLAALLADLQERRLLDSTLVLCMGEFGRTPKVNAAQGRDHWTKCWSVALAGGGIQGGRVVGETDGMAVTKGPVSVADLFATVLKSQGVDPAKEVKTSGGRPLRLSDGGAPVTGLF